MRAIFMPASYSPSQGEVEVDSLDEVLSLLGVETEDFDTLQVPGRGFMYLSRRAQQERGAVNTAASFVINEFLPVKINLFGPVIFVAAKADPFNN